MTILKNNQNTKNGRGGYRPGSGRKKGVGHKIQASTILKQIGRDMKTTYAEILVQELHKSILAGDTKLTAQYLAFIGNKCIADKIDIDHTTLGQSLHASFKFPQKELPDWTNVEKTIKIGE